MNEIGDAGDGKQGAAASEELSKGAETGLKIAAIGCLSAPVALFFFVAFTVFNFLSTCGEAPPPSPEEQRRIDREYEEDEQRRLRFEKGQNALWNTPASGLTRDAFVSEMLKCYDAIKRSRKNNPYHIMFDFDADRGLAALKEGSTSYSAIIQQKQDIVNKVEWTRVDCNFKGSGFTDFHERDTRFSDSYFVADNY